MRFLLTMIPSMITVLVTVLLLLHSSSMMLHIHTLDFNYIENIILSKPVHGYIATWLMNNNVRESDMYNEHVL